MSLVYNETQKILSEVVKRFVADHTPMAKIREVIDSNERYSTQTWRQITRELGLAALPIPEEYGGAGGTLADLAAVLRELGAGLVPSPFVGSAVLATATLVALHDEAAKKELLPQLAGGRITSALAVSEPRNRCWIPRKPATTATGTEETSTLSGTKTLVLNAEDADVLLVQARGIQSIGIYVVHKDADGLIVVGDNSVDPTTSTATVVFDNTPAWRLVGDAAAALEVVADQANLAVAALQSGAIKACLTMQTAYAKIRYSFGQPIGAYQGVKHKIADLYTAHCLADAQLRVATEAADQNTDNASAEITAARFLMNDLYFKAATQNQFIHGGLGHTWAHDSHWYTKNALVLAQLCGEQDYQRDRLADRLGI